MKKYFTFSMIILLFFFVAIGVVNADQKKYFSFKEPSNSEEAIIKERLDKELSNFKRVVNEDIAKGLDINLTGYSQIIDEELIESGDESLNRIFNDILLNQRVGDIFPTLFTNGNHGYIFEKKADGHNYIYVIEKDSEWKITSILDKAGEYITYEQVNSK